MPRIDRIPCRSLISRGEPPVLSSQFVKPISLTSCSTRTSATDTLTTFGNLLEKPADFSGAFYTERGIATSAPSSYTVHKETGDSNCLEERLMKNTGFRFRLFAVVALLVTPSLIGCSARASYGYRSYDPVYRDYHVYDRDERVYYDRWVVETRRPHRDFRRLREEDRREYWKWRHEHH
jgi:hypothetical protein